MESGNLKELYEKYHPNKEIEYYIFYNKFREEFQDSRRNDFSIIIMKYELEQCVFYIRIYKFTWPFGMFL